MSLRPLSATESVQAARRVYNVRSEIDIADIFATSELSRSFDFSTGKRFEGVAGAMLLQYKSGFGVIAKGKGEFEGDALLAIRGTDDLVRDLFLTDLNIGIQPTSTGMPVHAGFNKVFNSFKRDLERYFEKNNPKSVHCVGHSLGGGLATLAADWLAFNNIAEPVVYTFGSPRVGGMNFAKRLTGRIGAGNIYRVNHKTDIVSMIPIWPFTHVPQPGSDYFIHSPGIPWITYHYMQQYSDSVSGKAWDILKTKPTNQDSDKEIELWLGSTSPLLLTYHNMTMVNRAIMYLLKKILYATGIAFQAGIATSLTILDRLAMVLEKGAKAAIEIKSYVEALMRRVLSMMNAAVKVAKDITVEFIRWVLLRLTQTVYNLARMALQAVHR